MSELQQLYQEAILDHHRAPRNARLLEDPSHSGEGNNPLCGDRVRVTLRLGDAPDAAGSNPLSIVAVGCEVRGCALCRASGSIASELLLGRSVAASLVLIDGFLAAVAAPTPIESPARAATDPLGAVDPDAASEKTRAQLAPLLEVRHFPSRRRCSTLPWEALRAALCPAPGGGTAAP